MKRFSAPSECASSVRVAREQRAAAFSLALRAALARADLSHVALAHALGIERQALDRMVDPHEAISFRAADLAALPVAVLREVLAPVLEQHGLALVALPTSAVAASSALAVARVAREAGESVGEALEASADGSVTPAEGARVERECDDLIAAALELRDHAREAQRVPAPVPIRRAVPR